MSINYTKSQINDLYSKIDSNKVVLPNFQRDFVWDTKQQKSLITSFLIDLPIGSTLHLAGKKDDFAARLIGKTPTVVPHDECEYVLDGQQRITTLKNAFYDLYSDHSQWKDIYDQVFSNLRNRWFIVIDEENDTFNIKSLNFDEKYITSLEPDAVQHLVVNKKIWIKDSNKWFHPAYNPVDASGRPLHSHRKMTAQAKAALEEKLIPLYTISQLSEGLHRKVLEKFAQERVTQLQDAIRDNEKTLYEVLGHLEPEIETFDEDEIRDVWSRLQIRWSEAVATYLEKLLNKEIPIILLPSNEISRAASIFEEINNGGTPLSIFDLIVAKAAKSMDDLLSSVIRDQIKQDIDVVHLDSSVTSWNASIVSDISSNTPTKTFQSIYLNLMSIITFGLHQHQNIDKTLLTKEKILSMKSDDIKNHTTLVVQAISRAFAFLQFRCGIQKDSDVSYEYMILPIAYLLYHDEYWENVNILNKIEAWYWSSVFSGTYNVLRPDEQVKNDFDLLVNWLMDDNLSLVNEKYKNSANEVDLHNYKSFVLNRADYSDLNTLLMRNPNVEKIPKALHNSILQYILSLTPRDFLPNETVRLSAYNATAKKDLIKPSTNYKQYKLETHHIIPLATATSINQSSQEIRNSNSILNSPLNLADISEAANRQIGSMQVAQYMSELGTSILDHMLASASFYQRRDSESDEDYYVRCLEERHRILKDTITREVDNLLM